MHDLIIAALEESDTDYHINGNYATLQIVPEDENISLIKRLINLNTGLAERSAVYRQDGKFSSVHLMSYKQVNGKHINDHLTSYWFGEVNENWQAKWISKRDRMNIEVQYEG